MKIKKVLYIFIPPLLMAMGFLTGFASSNESIDIISPVDATYSRSLNVSNMPCSSSQTSKQAKIVKSNISGFEYSTFTWTDVKFYSNDTHCFLYQGGTITKDASYGLRSVRASFSGELYAYAGYEEGDYTDCYLLSNNTSIQVCGNYVQIYALSDTIVTSITFTYDCVQNSKEDGKHTYSNDICTKCSHERKSANEVNVVVLAGQSNAEGNTNAGTTGLNDLKAYVGTDKYNEYVKGYDNVKISYFNHYNDTPATYYHHSNKEDWISGRFVPVKLGFGKQYNWFGPELGMAEYVSKYYQSDKPLYIIKYCSGGTGFGDWNKNGRNYCWRSPSNTGTTGDLYLGLVKFIHNNLENLEREGFKPILRSFMWMQGENDSNNTLGPNYYYNLSTMLSDLRNEFAPYSKSNNGNSITFIDAKVSEISSWQNPQVVNSAKTQLSNDSSNNYLIDTTASGLNLKHNSDEGGGGDAYHYACGSMLRLGRAFGQNLVDHASINFKPGHIQVAETFVDDGISRNNSFVYEAEDSEYLPSIVIESTGTASGGKCLAYFRGSNNAKAVFRINSSKSEKALLKMTLASAMENQSLDFTHNTSRFRLATVNGEDVQLFGSLSPRGSSWYNWEMIKGYVNLKQGINTISIHYDTDEAYALQDFRINFDKIEILTSSASVSKNAVNNTTLTPENQSLFYNCQTEGSASTYYNISSFRTDRRSSVKMYLYSPNDESDVKLTFNFACACYNGSDITDGDGHDYDTIDHNMNEFGLLSCNGAPCGLIGTLVNRNGGAWDNYAEVIGYANLKSGLNEIEISTKRLFGAFSMNFKDMKVAASSSISNGITLYEAENANYTNTDTEFHATANGRNSPNFVHIATNSDKVTWNLSSAAREVTLIFKVASRITTPIGSLSQYNLLSINGKNVQLQGVLTTRQSWFDWVEIKANVTLINGNNTIVLGSSNGIYMQVDVLAVSI